MTLSVACLYFVEQVDDSWMTIWKEANIVHSSFCLGNLCGGIVKRIWNVSKRIANALSNIWTEHPQNATLPLSSTSESLWLAPFSKFWK
jgi:hypothetical protein